MDRTQDADDEDDAIRVEVKAFVKDKDFEGQRKMMHSDGRDHRDRDQRDHDHERDNHDRRQPLGIRHETERAEVADDDKDLVEIEVKAYSRSRDFEGKRHMIKGDDNRGPGRGIDWDATRHEDVDKEGDQDFVKIKVGIKDRGFEGERAERSRSTEHHHDDKPKNDRRPQHGREPEKRDDRHKTERAQEQDDDNNLVNIEVKAYSRSKDFEGKRQMKRVDDIRDYGIGNDQRGVFRKEAVDHERDESSVDIHVAIKDKSFEGERADKHERSRDNRDHHKKEHCEDFCKHIQAEVWEYMPECKGCQSAMAMYHF